MSDIPLTADSEKVRTVLFVSAIALTFESFILPIALELRRGGWRAAVACEGATTIRGLDCVIELPPFRRRGPIAVARAFLRLIRAIRDVRPDLIHLSSPAAIAIGRVAATLCRVPSVAMIHGTFLEPPSSRSLLFRMAECFGAWQSRYTIVLNGDDRRFYQAICRRGSVLLAPAGGAGVEVRSERGGLPRSGLVLYLGRFAVDKELDCLLRAYRLATAAYPDLVLRMVGASAPGDPAWVPSRMAGVEYAEWTDDPVAEMRSADAVVSASRREGFPMALAEAIVLGVPVVAVDNRGVRELCRQAGDEAIRVVKYDETALAHAIVSTITNRTLFARTLRSDLAHRWSRQSTIDFHLEVIGSVRLKP